MNTNTATATKQMSWARVTSINLGPAPTHISKLKPIQFLDKPKKREDHLIDEDRQYDSDELDDYEQLVKNYLDKRIIKKGSVIGLFLQKQGKYKLMIKKESNWLPAEQSDYNDLANEIKNLVENILPNLNEVFGFINNFKGGELVFKTKDLSIKRSKGARCDQAGKKGNNGVLKTLNKILGQDRYTDKNTKGIYALQLCVLEEFILRLRNKLKHDNKIWFLGPEQASLLNIESHQR